MTKQYKFEFALEIVDSEPSFRTIHYLGSKLRILDSIKEVIDEVDPEGNGICDLFSGSGSVSQHLSSERKIVSVDIQNYSHIICSALLKPTLDDFMYSFPEIIKKSELTPKFLSIFSPLIELEENLINGKLSTNLELVCNFLENSSLYSAINTDFTIGSTLLQEALKVIVRLRDFDKNTFLATKYFGGVYFSYKQAVMIDVILAEINKADLIYRYSLLAPLLSTASDIVNTVGKQFAQPIRPRNKNGEPKKGIIKQIRKDRNLDVISTFEHWVQKIFKSSKISKLNHEIFKMDYKEALNRLKNDVSIVYADPPYTRDHYSRFYHGLETLCLMDYPSVSTTNIGGKTRLSRGLYREEREQSDFCIRSKAPKAFEELFKIISEKGKTLLLSYSPYDKSKEVHPRVVEIEKLESLASNYFASIEIRSLGKFAHSKLNRADLHLQAEESAEIILICKN